MGMRRGLVGLFTALAMTASLGTVAYAEDVQFRVGETRVYVATDSPTEFSTTSKTGLIKIDNSCFANTSVSEKDGVFCWGREDTGSPVKYVTGVKYSVHSSNTPVSDNGLPSWNLTTGDGGNSHMAVTIEPNSDKSVYDIKATGTVGDKTYPLGIAYIEISIDGLPKRSSDEMYEFNGRKYDSFRYGDIKLTTAGYPVSYGFSTYSQKVFEYPLEIVDTKTGKRKKLFTIRLEAPMLF